MFKNFFNTKDAGILLLLLEYTITSLGIINYQTL